MTNRMNYNVNIPLEEEKIDSAVMEIEKSLQNAEFENKHIVAVTLLIESELLGWKDFFADKNKNSEAKVTCGRFIRKDYVKISIKGDRYFPDKSDDESYPYLQKMMYSSINDYGITMNRSYSRGENILEIILPKKSVNPLVKNIIAVLLAVVTFLATSPLQPEVKSIIVESVLSPAFSTILGLLTMTAMVLIFFSITSSIVNMGEISKLSKYAGKTIRTYMIWMLVQLLLIMIIVLSSSPIMYGDGGFDYSSAGDIYQMILNIIPKDIVSPFSTGNALQISFLAACIGVLLLVGKSKTETIINFVNEASDITFQALKYVCKFVPLIVYLSISKMLISDMFSNLISSWKMVAYSVAAGILFVIAVFIYTKIKMKIPFIEIIKGSVPIAITAFATSSSYATSEVMFDYAKKHNTTQKSIDFNFPMAQIFFKPCFLTTLTVVPLCLCEVYSIKIPITQLVTFVVAALLLSIACPAVQGGAAASLAVLLGMLGIGAEGIAIALAIDVVLDMIGTTVKCVSTSNLLVVFGNDSGQKSPN